MGRPVNSKVPEAGYVSKTQFEQTGSIAQSDFAVVADLDNTRKIAFDASGQSKGKTVTIAAGANTGNITLTLPVSSGTVATQSSDFSYQTSALDYWWNNSTTVGSVDAFVGTAYGTGRPFGMITVDVDSHGDISTLTQDLVFNTGAMTNAPNTYGGQTGSVFIATGPIIVPTGTATGATTGGISLQTGKPGGGASAGGILIATSNTDGPLANTISLFSPTIYMGPVAGAYGADSWSIDQNGNLQWLGNIDLTGGIDLGGSALVANGGGTINGTFAVSLSASSTFDVGGHCTLQNVVDPSSAQDAATKNYVDTNTFTSTVITANGSAQNTAHGLGATPSKVHVSAYDTTSAGIIAAGYAITEGAHTSTNVIVTATSGLKYKILAKK